MCIDTAAGQEINNVASRIEAVYILCTENLIVITKERFLCKYWVHFKVCF